MIRTRAWRFPAEGQRLVVSGEGGVPAVAATDPGGNPRIRLTQPRTWSITNTTVPADLVRHTLLQVALPPGSSMPLEWEPWLQANGLADLHRAGVITDLLPDWQPEDPTKPPFDPNVRSR